MVSWIKKAAPGTSTSGQVAADQFNQMIDYITNVNIASVDTALEPNIATITRYKDNVFRLWHAAGGSFTYRFRTSTLAASIDVTLPVLTANDTFVFNNNTATLQGKVIEAGANSITASGAALGGLFKNNATKYVNFARGATDTVLTASATDLIYKKLTDANIDSAAAITWSKISKSGSDLNDFGNVAISGPVLNESLVYDGAQWTNATVTGGGGAGEANTGSNVGTGGVGVFKQKTGVNLQFKKINAASGGGITITDDTGNDEIDVGITAGGITNAMINASAAIDYSKLNLVGAIQDTDLAVGAISYANLTLTNSIVNTDVNSSAAIARSKLNFGSGLVNADIATGAAIAKAKLASLDVVNADVNSSAAIAWSKISKTGSSLSDIDNTAIVTPAAGESLVYNGTDWANAAAQGLIYDYIVYKVGSTYKIFKVATGTNLTTTTTDVSLLVNAAIVDMDANGGTIYFRSGTYPCLTTMDINADDLGNVSPAGSGSGGVTLLGNGYGTCLSWTPSGALTNGIDWMINGSKIESMRLMANSNVTNILHATGHTSTVSHAGRNAFIHVFFEGPVPDTPVTGQRGIFMDTSTLQGPYYFKYTDCHFLWLDHGYYAPSSGSTTAFFTACDWDRCNTGIYIGDEGQNFGTDLYFQGSTTAGISGLHLGAGASMNYFDRLTGEFLHATLPCQTLLLDSGSNWNTVKSVVNALASSGADSVTVRDNSGANRNILEWYHGGQPIGFKYGRAFQIGGTASVPTLAFDDLTDTTFQYLQTSGYANPRMSFRKWGALTNTTQTGGLGLWNGYLTAAAGTWALQMSDGSGLFGRHTSGATSGNQAGVRTTSTATRRIRNGTLKGKFSLVANTSVKFFIGYATGSFMSGTGVAPLANINGIGVYGETGNSANMQIFHNDGGATAVSEDFTAPDTIDTSPHTFSIVANDGVPNYIVTLDAQSKTITTDIPTSGQGMNMNCFVETRTTAAREMDVYYLEYFDGIGA